MEWYDITFYESINWSRPLIAWAAQMLPTVAWPYYRMGGRGVTTLTQECQKHIFRQFPQTSFLVKMLRVKAVTWAVTVEAFTIVQVMELAISIYRWSRIWVSNPIVAVQDSTDITIGIVQKTKVKKQKHVRMLSNDNNKNMTKSHNGLT